MNTLESIEMIERLHAALKVADEGRNYANELLQIAAVDITKLKKSIDKISKRSRERAEELDLLRTQVRELRHNRDRLMEYLERECGGKCNAEYNPCNARYLLNKIMDYEVKK